MTKEEFENIKENKRWTITSTDIYTRYFFIIFPITIVFIGSVMAFSGFNNDVIDLKIASIIILSFGLFLTVFVAIRLYQNQVFDSFQIEGLTKNKVDFALKTAMLDNVKFHKIGYYTATTNISWLSWGEQITIVINNNELLVNIRPTGGSFVFQPITIFKDRQIIKTIIRELQNELTA